MALRFRPHLGTVVMAAFLATGTAASPARSAGLEDLTGRDLYLRFCSACHGAQGYGDGPLADQFKVLIPDLTRITARNSGIATGKFPAERVRDIVDGQTRVAAHGTRQMPVWGFAFAAGLDGSASSQQAADAMVNRIVEYLASIQQ